MQKSDNQKETFLKYEANAWFKRNKLAIDKYHPQNDEVVSLLKNYSISPSRVLEIGCSAGYRLNGIKSVFNACEVEGIDPSIEAINYGKEKYSNVKLQHGTVDDMNFFEDSRFDVVIIGFVLYVVDRQLLFKSICEIDRVLNADGHLIIIDFFADTPRKTPYHHIQEFQAYSFKQNYDELFCSSKLYHLVSKSCMDHMSHELAAKDDFQNMVSVSLLKKNIYAAYK